MGQNNGRFNFRLWR